MAATDSSQKQQPAVDKVRQLLYRRLKVVLPTGRIIEGDLACLDKQGNLILSNAAEHINASSSSSSCSSAPNSSSSSSSKASQPALNQLGMVLIPKAQQQEVLMEVTLSERAAMLSLVGSS